MLEKKGWCVCSIESYGEHGYRGDQRKLFLSDPVESCETEKREWIYLSVNGSVKCYRLKDAPPKFMLKSSPPIS